MTNDPDLTSNHGPSPEDVVADRQEVYTADRRRPGRIAEVRTELIGLMRTPTDGPPPSDVHEDRGNPFEGIAIGVLISAVLWIGFFFAAEFLWHLALAILP